MEKLDLDKDFKEAMVEFDVCKKYARQIINSFPFAWGSGTSNLNDFAAFIAEIRSDAVVGITLKVENLENENKRLREVLTSLKRSKMMAKQGDRVGAIRSANSEEVVFYGYGVYEGDTLPPDFPIPNPTIKLDNGKIVYGYECWWGPEEKVKEMIGGRKVTDVFPDR